MTLDEIDLTQRELYRQGFPHEVFQHLRDEAPVWRHPEADWSDTLGQDFWVISRHADIREISRNPEVFSSRLGPGLGYDGTGLMLVDLDGQQHVHQRKLISAGFTPRMTRRLEDQARKWAKEIVDDALERETVEFVQDVAYQLPMHMIADILGIPREDRDWLFALTKDMLMCTDPEYPFPAERREELSAELFGYGQKLTAHKREVPGDDILTLLATVETEGSDGRPALLGQLELDAFFVLLTVAGSETTRNAISEGLKQLLAEPAQLQALRDDPSLLKGAAEEIIRWSSPVAYFKRMVQEDVTIGDVTIPAGDRVTLWYPSGNRDERAFDEPHRFDIQRRPNEHVSFGGGGVHFCLGAHLARREITILFEELLRRTAEIELVGEPGYSVVGIGNPILFALGDLPVRLKAA